MEGVRSCPRCRQYPPFSKDPWSHTDWESWTWPDANQQVPDKGTKDYRKALTDTVSQTHDQQILATINLLILIIKGTKHDSQDLQLYSPFPQQKCQEDKLNAHSIRIFSIIKMEFLRKIWEYLIQCQFDLIMLATVDMGIMKAPKGLS